MCNSNKHNCKIEDKKRKNNAFKLLINLWVRERAVQLFSFLSSTFGVDVCSALKEQPGSLNVIMDMLKDGYVELVHAIAASFLSDLPPEISRYHHCRGLCWCSFKEVRKEHRRKLAEMKSTSWIFSPRK